MNVPPERTAIIAAWLEEGPYELPESTRRAISVDLRTTHQSRRSIWSPWRFPTVDRLSLVALAAVAVIVLAVAGVAVYRIAPDDSNVGGPPPTPLPSPSPSPSEAPSAAPIPTALVIPVMSELFVSSRHGYSVMYPADWSVTDAEQAWSPPDWKARDSPDEPFDYISEGDRPPWLRAASAPLPDSLPDVHDWIDEFLIFGDPRCVPPRRTQEVVSIDGTPGRIWDGCDQVEATIVVGGRVYMFTLAFGDSGVTNGRELFDAFAATIDLRPEDAALPSLRP